MTTLERLAEWKAVGTITQLQHDTLAALVRNARYRTEPRGSRDRVD